MNLSIYLLLVLCGLLLLILALRLFGGSSRSESRPRPGRQMRTRKQMMEAQARALKDTRHAADSNLEMPRELASIPTPWGWPGYQGKKTTQASGRAPEQNGKTEGDSSMGRWVDNLVSEKKTVEDQEYILKKDASLRALLDDRFGPESMQKNSESIRTPPTPGDVASEKNGNGRLATTSTLRGARGPQNRDPRPRPINLSRIKDFKSPKGW